MDRRLTPANDRVAADSLRGQVDAPAYSAGEPMRIAVPFVDLDRAPNGPRDRQLLLGEAVTVYDRHEGRAFVQAAKDGYVGYVPETALADLPDPTHWVAVPGSHAYSRPQIKAPETAMLVFGNAVRVVSEDKRFFETADGAFIPKRHLWPIGKRFSDPVTAAQLHFGAPYLWGGNTTRGIDCSGLVQTAMLASGIDCPGDCDMQRQALGHDLPPDAVLQRGDVLFWKTHCGMLVDAETLIHANAGYMAVTYEPLEAAIARIEAEGEGPVIARKRL
jgi:hypothetical protein